MDVARGLRAWLAACLLLAQCALQPALAQPAGPKLPDPALVQKVADQGPLRVIVTLDAGIAPPAARDEISERELALLQSRVAAAAAALEAELHQQVGPASARVDRRYRSMPLMALRVDSAGLDALLGSARVLQVVEDTMKAPLLEDSVPLIHADMAHSQGVDGHGQVVVIIDTGIDVDHPFFNDDAGNSRIVDGACFSGGGDESLCPGRVETQYGRDAARVDPVHVPRCTHNGRNLCYHGTHVAGIAAGGNANVGFVGVAPAAKIIAIKAAKRRDSTAACDDQPAPCTRYATADLLSALDYTIELRGRYPIAAVNMSLGDGEYEDYCNSDPLYWGITVLRGRGVATTIATGNSGNFSAISAPACISSGIAVASTTKGDAISGFSDMAATVDLLAPGSSIQSAVPGGGYGFLSGTSMAAPHVAGAWAVMKSLVPTASVSQILNAFISTGVNIQQRLYIEFLDLTLIGVTKPRIEVWAALRELGMKTVTPLHGSGGTIVPAAPVVVASGGAVAIELHPDPGYDVDQVGGSCPGELWGGNFIAGPITQDCALRVTFKKKPTYAIRSSVAVTYTGRIAPEGLVTVGPGGTWSFTLTPVVGYAVDFVDGTCGGTLSGATFKTAPVFADCTVVAHFRTAWHVTTEADGRGWIDPADTWVGDGMGASFVLTPYLHHALERVEGTCDGVLGDHVTVFGARTYTIGPVRQACTIVAVFRQRPIKVPLVDVSTSVGGVIKPPHIDVGPLDRVPFLILPDRGYAIASVGGTCGGTLAGNVYTTEPIVPGCSVVATFAPEVQRIAPVPTLAQWALGVLAALLAGLAWAALRRRRPTP